VRLVEYSDHEAVLQLRKPYRRSLLFRTIHYNNTNCVKVDAPNLQSLECSVTDSVFINCVETPRECQLRGWFALVKPTSLLLKIPFFRILIRDIYCLVSR
jgi:hypothetical protein